MNTSQAIRTVGLTMGLFCGTLTMAQTANPTSPLSQTFVRVNGEAVPVSQAELLLREQMGRGLANTPELQTAVRDAVINQTLMAQEAVKAGIDKTPLVEAQLAALRQQLLAQAWQQSVLQKLQVTDAQIQAEYDRQKTALGSTEYQLRHILVAEESTARLLLETLGRGGDIARLAAEHSLDETSKAQGGLTPWTAQGQLQPAVRDVATQLKKGELHKTPVRTAQGWHVLFLEDSRPYSAPALDSVRLQVVNALAQQQLQTALEQLRKTARIE